MKNVLAQKERLSSLDQLRGVCALLVVAQHILTYFFHNACAWLFEHLIDIGRIGVVGFFAISGYIIPLSLKLDGGEGKEKIISFWIKRFFRLWPLYIFTIVIAYVFNLEDPAHSFVLWERLVNLTMLQEYFGVHNVLNVFWTLSIEVVFYIVITGAFILKIKENERYLVRGVNILLISALCLGIIRYFSEIKLPIALFLALAIMFLAGLWRVLGCLPWRVVCLCWLPLLVAICVFSYSKSHEWFHDSPLRYVVSYILGFLLFVWSFRWRKIWGLRFLGLISYSIYLVHMLILTFVEKQQIGSYYIGIAVLFIVFLSAVTYFIIESPFIWLGRYFASKINGSRADA